jgi:hypothetical protein
MDAAIWIDILAASVRIATPLLLAALGGILAERAGTFAVGLEGQMLAGAFLGVIGTHLLHSTGAGLVASCAGGMFMAPSSPSPRCASTPSRWSPAWPPTSWRWGSPASCCGRRPGAAARR